ncbi:MAG: archaeal cell division control protein 6 [Candidatus Woesearchaeota archaeon]|nr:archaeal cell division control protein 6 [Candidatus Woesearchaeota archaeon]
MVLFKDILGAEETIFKNPVALEPEYMPKEIPYREEEQHYIAECIKPLILGRNGRNLQIYGESGIGKSLAVKSVLEELKEETSEVYPIYINCWQKPTSFKIMLEMCNQIEYKFTHNKSTEELFDIIKKIINKKAAVFVFDEIDKAQDTDFLYFILEEIYKKSIIVISNYEKWMISLDPRIKSRLSPDSLYFKKYSKKEILGIIRRRIESAFYPGVFNEEGIERIANVVEESSDIRLALFLLNEAGNNAESMSRRKVTIEDVEKAIERINKYSSKKTELLDDSDQLTLDIINQGNGLKIGDAFKRYSEKGGKGGYKTFQRRIDKLAKNNFIEIEKINGGSEGKTSLLKPKNKRLNEFK